MKTASANKPSPKWSLATSFWFCVVAIAIVIPLITLTVHKSIWVELEIVTGILAVLMFGYFSIILHQGIRFSDKKRVLVDWPAGRPTELLDSVGWSPDVGLFSSAGAESGCLGLIIGIILDVVVTILLAFLLSFMFWIGLNAIAGVFLFLFWVHTRWLRYLVTTGRRCRGNWKRSLVHAAMTAIRFSVWFYIAFCIVRKVTEWLT